MMTDKPTFVSRDMMTADEGYVQWMADIKQRFRQSQLKAAVRVNTAMLEFYWSMGRDIVELRAESKWGSGFFSQLSLDLRTAFPNERGFSSANLRYMKRWYQFYYEQVTILQQPAEELNVANRQQAADEFEEDKKGQQVAELKKQKIKLSLSQQDEWEEYFDQYKTACNIISYQIAATDRQIDLHVYRLYGLTYDEVLTVDPQTTLTRVEYESNQYESNQYDM